jgi:hypothetical protein
MGILRKVFGPSRDEIWRKLTEAVDGRHVGSTFFKAGRVEATHGEWIVTLDTHTVSTGETTIIHTRVTGVIKDLDRLKALYELFAETLDGLCRMGSAYETGTDLRL